MSTKAVSIKKARHVKQLLFEALGGIGGVSIGICRRDGRYAVKVNIVAKKPGKISFLNEISGVPVYLALVARAVARKA